MNCSECDTIHCNSLTIYYNTNCRTDCTDVSRPVDKTKLIIKTYSNVSLNIIQNDSRQALVLGFPSVRYL